MALELRRVGFDPPDDDGREGSEWWGKAHRKQDQVEVRTKEHGDAVDGAVILAEEGEMRSQPIGLRRGSEFDRSVVFVT